MGNRKCSRKIFIRICIFYKQRHVHVYVCMYVLYIYTEQCILKSNVVYSAQKLSETFLKLTSRGFYSYYMCRRIYTVHIQVLYTKHILYMLNIYKLGTLFYMFTSTAEIQIIFDVVQTAEK